VESYTKYFLKKSSVVEVENITSKTPMYITRIMAS
jgi:hypothetical protein